MKDESKAWLLWSLYGICAVGSLAWAAALAWVVIRVLFLAD